MKIATAMWHYPHRTTIENIEFFIRNGITTMGMNQSQLIDACIEGKGDEVARVLKSGNADMTLHGDMACSHSTEDVADFKERMNIVGEWQRKYGLISVISFDVRQSVRDNVSEYVDYVLTTIPGCSVALEDFGLNDAERSQIEYLKSEPRFGYLIDIGHMYIRLCGGNPDLPHTLFQNSADECEACDNPGFDEFIRALHSKEFPVKEIHLHNNDGVRDMHYFLEDGKLDISVIARVLKEIGYDGIVTIESAPGFMFECKCPESDVGILRDIEYWKELTEYEEEC